MQPHPSIDLGHGPRAISDVRRVAPPTERWSVVAHLSTPDGHAATVLATFGRQALDDHGERFGHGVAWAIASEEDATYHHRTGVDAASALHCLQRVREGRWSNDPRLDRAVAEVLERGGVPHPDQLLGGEMRVGRGLLDVELGTHRLHTDERGRHHLVLGREGDELGCALTFEASASEEGRCRVTGSLRRGHREDAQLEGIGRCVAARDEDLLGVGDRLRIDLHLDDGSDLVIDATAALGEGGLLSTATWTPTGGGPRLVTVTLEPIETWQSTRTFREYPVRWRVSSDELGLELEVEPAFADQELVSLVGAPTAWAGRVLARGAARGIATSGVGVLVAPPRASHLDLESFFKAVGRVVRGSVARALPLDLDRRAADLLVGGEHTPGALDGVDLEQLSRTLIRPIRDVVDRGGKAWRSYAAIACCDLVGGDSRRFVEWLAMPELMHVGSLIVDDVQDRSLIRRGGPAAHVIHGEAQAINAGTAAYFLTQRMLVSSKHLSDCERLTIYDLYFEAMRAGHAGQAIDLDGLDTALSDAVASGRAAALEERVLAVHRLKTAVPAACLARMGAVAGGGSPEQIAAVGAFFEALGLAFQIIDDVLNLRGFQGDLKARGEDITQGKVTLPVAEAMRRMDRPAREALAAALRSRPEEPAAVAAVIATIEACGALDACRDRASALVETGWAQLDPLVPDSLAKIMLRAFGWFVLERHY